MSMSRNIVPTANIRIMFDTTGSANWTKSMTWCCIRIEQVKHANSYWGFEPIITCYGYIDKLGFGSGVLDDVPFVGGMCNWLRLPSMALPWRVRARPINEHAFHLCFAITSTVDIQVMLYIWCYIIDGLIYTFALHNWSPHTTCLLYRSTLSDCCSCLMSRVWNASQFSCRWTVYTSLLRIKPSCCSVRYANDASELV